MNILAVDASTMINTVAVCAEGRVLAETVVACGRKHAERMLDTVQWVLNEAGCTLDDIDALAVSKGPGSFTGVRVGVSALKGLALGRDLPLVGVPTLDAMTQLIPPRDGLVCPLLDAKMKEVFGAVYEFKAGVRTKRTTDLVAPVEVVLEQCDGQPVVLGDGAAAYRERILAVRPDVVFATPACDGPRASAVAQEALLMLSKGCETEPALVTPVYLRKSQAEIARDAREAASV